MHFEIEEFNDKQLLCAALLFLQLFIVKAARISELKLYSEIRGNSCDSISFAPGKLR